VDLAAVDNLSSTAGIVAIAAAAVAVVALGTSLSLVMAIRRLRAGQRAVLGDGQRDLVEQAAELESSFRALESYVLDAANRLEGRVVHVERRLDGTVAYRALVRYDAYGEMSGRQSTSIALLDATKSGIVLSSIHHREHARLYAKQVSHGKPELELSPEEQEAVRMALAGGANSASQAPDAEQR
jgi:Protein of unknown function (DUF4446)